VEVADRANERERDDVAEETNIALRLEVLDFVIAREADEDAVKRGDADKDALRLADGVDERLGLAETLRETDTDADAETVRAAERDLDKRVLALGDRDTETMADANGAMLRVALSERLGEALHAA
jgi:hypothetical protein